MMTSRSVTALPAAFCPLKHLQISNHGPVAQCSILTSAKACFEKSPAFPAMNSVDGGSQMCSAGQGVQPKAPLLI